jgi:alanyl-tRNA synthetase
MRARELKDKYLSFFKAKNHTEIPSVSLIPENDRSALFISAGMHPLVPYLLGQPHPAGKNLVSIQECLRTGDIDQVGDTTHHTWFEMLGNWSLGDYFKDESIALSYEFVTQVLKIDPSFLHITCFEGDKNAPQDTISYQAWLKLGIKKDRIHYLPKKDNWWGPAGATGPCGPDTEIFVDVFPSLPQEDFVAGNQRGRYIEIWNNVFMEYSLDNQGHHSLLPKKNVDTGMGIERTTTVLSGLTDNYQSTIWQPIIKKIEDQTGLAYQDHSSSMRIIADHLRSAVFVLADDVEPSPKEAGYVLRRLIRRAIVQAKNLGLTKNFTTSLAQVIIDNQDNYAGDYPELKRNHDLILKTLDDEENRFRLTLDRGLKEISRFIGQKKLDGSSAFDIYQTHGFPLEMIVEEAQKENYSLDKDFEKKFKSAQEIHTKLSQTAAKGKFAGGLAGHDPQILAYHTCTHLLHTALREVLGDHVKQAGSNITTQRLRFDFTHPQKLTPDEIKKITDLVNGYIASALPVIKESMTYQESQKRGIISFFKDRYPETVTAYFIGDPQKAISAELCIGPHVENTSQLGHFSIQKEESASLGKRRIYALLS